MANTRTKSPPPTTSPSDEIVELRPPPDSGFSGTAKFLSIAQAALIEELLNRGYTKVTR